MASTKSSKKSSSKKSSSKKSSAKILSLSGASDADAGAAVMAVSTAEDAGDAKQSAIFQCLVECFRRNGFPIISPSARIVWSTIPNNVITRIGNCVRVCIIGKGFQSPGWAGPFRNLKNQNRVSVVANLVSSMAMVVRP